jgi:hypothetical protein
VPLTAHSQSLDELKKQYDPVSPVSYQTMNPSLVVGPETTVSAQEEQLAEMKAKELEEIKAREEKVFLDTDYKFFQSLAEPQQEDELDKATKKDMVEKDLQLAKQTDSTVKTEIKTTAPAPLSPTESAAIDTRRKLMMKKISESSHTIKSCIVEVRKKGIPFKGSEMTLGWDILQSGKVEDAKIQSTDVANEEIKKCILASMSEWSFAEAMQNTTKKARIQYTFRFNTGPKEAKDTATTSKENLALKASDKAPSQN